VKDIRLETQDSKSPGNFRECAVEKLEKEKPDAHKVFLKLKSDSEESLGRPDMGVELLQRQLRKCDEELTSKHPNLRRSLEKVLRSILVFKDLAASPLRFDPTHAAPIAWAGVTSVMQVRIRIAVFLSVP
jgi:hypothetical protein